MTQLNGYLATNRVTDPFALVASLEGIDAPLRERATSHAPMKQAFQQSNTYQFANEPQQAELLREWRGQYVANTRNEAVVAAERLADVKQKLDREYKLRAKEVEATRDYAKIQHYATETQKRLDRVHPMGRLDEALKLIADADRRGDHPLKEGVRDACWDLISSAARPSEGAGADRRAQQIRAAWRARDEAEQAPLREVDAALEHWQQHYEQVSGMVDRVGRVVEQDQPLAAVIAGAGSDPESSWAVQLGLKAPAVRGEMVEA